MHGKIYIPLMLIIGYREGYKMVEKSNPRKYVLIKIPKSLADAIDKLVGQYGFTSRAEVVKEATRKILQQYIHEELVAEEVVQG